MKHYHKLSKKKLNKIISNINRRVFIDENITEREKFKQIIIDNEYTPYLISSFGRVFSLIKHENKPYELKMQLSQTPGYYIVNLYFGYYNRAMLVHRLVATHFIPNKKHLPIINHIDGNKTNNHYRNLEWCTQQYNIQHAYEHGLSRPRPILFTTEQIEEVCKLLSMNVPTAEISIKTGVDIPDIRHILSKNTWRNVSDKYDFSDYMFGKNKEKMREKELKLHQASKLLEENELTMREIASKVGLPYYELGNIFKGRYKKIVNNYDISKFNRYEHRRRGKRN